MKLRLILPLVFLAVLFGILGKGLLLNPTIVPSPLINKSIPQFSLPTLFDSQKNITDKNFLGHVTLLNVWATWCAACVEEHNFLVEAAKENSIVFYGLDYKDDRNDAKTWLKQHGNPYQVVAFDEAGKVAIDWGVYGTPETFLIDKKGIIRYKQIGPLSADIWQKTFVPLISQLQNESSV